MIYEKQGIIDSIRLDRTIIYISFGLLILGWMLRSNLGEIRID